MLALVSPDHRIELAFRVDERGRPLYSVHWGDRVVVEESPILVTMEEGGLLRDLEVMDTQSRSYDERYPIYAGKAREGRARGVERTVALRERGGGRELVLRFRVQNDGVALRYELPGEGTVGIADEAIEFRFAGDWPCWSLPLPHFGSSFEGEYGRRSLGQWTPGELRGLPLVAQVPDGPTVALGEANLGGHAGMLLTARAGRGLTAVTQLSPSYDPEESARVRAALPHRSAWRYLMLGERPADLIASTLPQDLSEPCALEDTGWIRPGKVAWDWWSGPVAPNQSFTAGMNDATFRHWIEFAQAMEIEYVMLDGGWYADGDVRKAQAALDVPGLVAYAQARGVELLLWNHQADLRPVVDEAFDLYARWGVKGVKVDFFDRNDAAQVAWTHEVVRKAAERKLLVNLHGVFPSEGLERTYPNLMTQEGVMGAEYHKWSRRVTPAHNVTLPFTRGLVGPMDYTPGGFDNRSPAKFEPRDRAPMVMGTRAHGLAMYVVYASGLQMVSDYPGAILGQPGSEFLREVPAAWDETRGVLGEIGQYVVTARRRGERWFLGAMTNEEGRTLEVPLTFLNHPRRARLFLDAGEPKALRIEERTLGPSDRLRLELAPSGGAAVVFGP